MDIFEALSSGARTSKEIQALTSRSQASVSKLIRQNSNIIQLPGKRPHSYALTRPAFGADDTIPIATVDANGKTVPRAMLRPLRPQRYIAVLLSGASALLAGESNTGLFDTLPYYLDDARPQGFLGRLIAQQLSAQSDEFSDEPDDWSDDQVGRYLISNGDDLPGDMVFGFSMMNRLRRQPVINTRSNYSAIAASTLDGSTGVSSAGGEQQKFITFISDIESHVIVKFTPAYEDFTSMRWRDILVTEFHALTVLSEYGFSTADTKLFEQNDRYFLESKRFDRRGWSGRHSMYSLRTVDAEYLGSGGSWVEVTEGLRSLELISIFDSDQVKELQLFGTLINNTDMHLGNLSFAIDGDRFSLLPAYDMCSMGFAPKGSEVLDLAFALPELNERLKTSKTRRVLDAAAEFWQRVAADNRTSDALREFIVSSDVSKKIKEMDA